MPSRSARLGHRQDKPLAIGLGDWACAHRVPPLQRQDDLPSVPTMIRTDVTLNVTRRVTLVETPSISFPIGRPEAALLTFTAPSRNGFGQLRGPKPFLATVDAGGIRGHAGPDLRWTGPPSVALASARVSADPSPAASQTHRWEEDCDGYPVARAASRRSTCGIDR
jgi:hypothetical protein